jgi:hypothetical protein
VQARALLDLALPSEVLFACFGKMICGKLGKLLPSLETIFGIPSRKWAWPIDISRWPAIIHIVMSDAGRTDEARQPEGE